MKKRKKSKSSKAYQLEFSERVDFIRELLALGCFEQTIYRECYLRWSLPKGKASKLLATAQKQLLERTSKAKDDHKRDAIAFLDEIIRKPDVQDRHRLKAQEQKNRILGLDAPISIKTDIELKAEENRVIAESLIEDNPQLMAEIVKVARNAIQEKK